MARIRAQERLASAAAAAAAEAAVITSAAGSARLPSSPADVAELSVNGNAGCSAAQSAPESDAQPASSAKEKRRLAGKMAKRAAAEERQAAAAPAPSEPPAGLKPRKRRKDREPAAGVVPAAPDSDRSTSEQAELPRTSGTWWGARRFVSSGCLTGLRRDEAAPAAQQRVEFSESTQVCCLD